jgi:SAM-dependent methyltransferase
VGLDPVSIRRSYDRVAGRYADELIDELGYKPLDRALLAVLAEDVRGRGGGLVADLGAGPGQVAAHLRDLGAEALALDLSPEMAAIGRDRLGLTTVAGSLTALPFRDGGLAGATAFYCLIHLDDAGLDATLPELARVVAAGGPLLVAFHTGEEVRHLDEWWDEQVDVDFRFLQPGPIAERLERAGFVVEAVLERAPYPDEADTHRAYILARSMP